MQLIRSFTQILPDGRTLEMSLHRSDSFLYLASLIADPRREEGLWIGEMGLCFKAQAGELLKKIKELSYRAATSDTFKIEAQIMYGAYVERDGKTSPLRLDICTDYESVSLAFHGRHKLEQFLNDLETSLAWAI